MKFVFFLSCLVIALAETDYYEPFESVTAEPENVTEMESTTDSEETTDQTPNTYDLLSPFLEILATPWNNLTEEQRTNWEEMFASFESSEMQMILNGFGITPKMVHTTAYLLVSNAKLSKIQDEFQLMLNENPRFAVFFSFFYSTVERYASDLETLLIKGVLNVENIVRTIASQDMGVHEFVRDLATVLDDQLPRRMQNIFGPQFGTFLGKTFAFFLDNVCKEIGTIDVSDEEYVSPKTICTTVDQMLRVVMEDMYHEIEDNRNRGIQYQDFKVKYNSTEFNSGY